MLSLGGWGGCRDCSEVFSTKKGRKLFTRSVKELLEFFKADGIDLDWEYPAIEGYPGHPFKPEDRANFTALVKQLRKKLGKSKIISFAAGGFTTFLEHSIEWTNVMKYANFVNLMTYDLINGGSTSTGHHTPLYSTAGQAESGDHAVNYLLAAGIPANKLVLGAAFYGRLFDSVQNINNGLYQPARFRAYIPGKFIPDNLADKEGFVYYWDDIAKAPYYYNPVTRSFLTFENAESLTYKTRYVKEKKLFGIMFWQLTEDRSEGGFLHAISQEMNR
jgi:chitinase